MHFSRRPSEKPLASGHFDIGTDHSAVSFFMVFTTTSSIMTPATFFFVEARDHVFLV